MGVRVDGGGGWKQVLMTAALCSDLAQVDWAASRMGPPFSPSREDVAVKMGRQRGIQQLQDKCFINDWVASFAPCWLAGWLVAVMGI